MAIHKKEDRSLYQLRPSVNVPCSKRLPTNKHNDERPCQSNKQSQKSKNQNNYCLNNLLDSNGSWLLLPFVFVVPERLRSEMLALL